MRAVLRRSSERGGERGQRVLVRH